MRQFKLLLSLLPLTLVSTSLPTTANPTNPTIVNGTVTISNPNPTTLEITNTPGSIINWQGFSINPGELTRFLQQSPESAILNRVIGSDPSQILGTLQSNGRVFLINPNGILFGTGAVINVQGLIASTLNLSDQDFLNGNYLFSQIGTGAPVTVQTGAQLTTTDGGQIWLMAQSIEQQAGSNITTPTGQTVLAAGTQVQVVESALGNMVFNVTTDGTNNLQTLGAIASQKGAAGLFADNITHSGSINAQSTNDIPGLVVLNATNNLTIEDNGVINVESTDNSDGGIINLTAGNKLEVERLAEVSADGGISGGDGGRITLTAHDLRVSQVANGMQNLHANARHADGVNGTVILNETGIHSYNPADGEFQVNEFTTDGQTVPAIATLADGKLVVTWESDEQDGDAHGVYARIYNPDTDRWSDEFPINTTTANDQDTSAIAALPNGNFVVTWESEGQDGNRNGVYGRIFDANGNAQTNEFLINITTNDRQENSAITALANGNFVVTWGSQGQDGNNKGVFGRIFAADGVAQTGEFPINTTTDRRQDVPTIAALPNGNFVVAWQSFAQDGNQEGIYGRIFDTNGVAQTDELPINTTINEEQEAPAIAALTDGSFVVTWDSDEQDGSRNAVIGRRFDINGNAITDEFQVNTYTNEPQDTSAVTGLADGGFIVTWESWRQDGSTLNSVYAQRFDSQGNPVANNNAPPTGNAQGNEFMVNTFIIGDQDNPAIASLANSGFIVAWESFNQDGDGNGIYTQRFDKTPAPFTPTNSLTAELGPVANFTTRPNLSNGVITPPTTSVDPTTPIDPTTPVDPMDPIDPVDPTTPVAPMDPIAPIDPINPVNRVNPINPVPSGEISPEVEQGIALSYPTCNTLKLQRLEEEDTIEPDLNHRWHECKRWLYEEEQSEAIQIVEEIQSNNSQEQVYAQMIGEEEYSLTRSLSWGARQAYWQEHEQMQNTLSVEEYANYLKRIRNLSEEERVEYFEELAQRMKY